MFGLSPRTGARLAAPALLVALTAAGTTGCAVPITGTAFPVPVVSAPAPAPTRGTVPDVRWERVTDPGSGDSVLLPGPVENTAFEDGGRAYSARIPPAGLTLVSVSVQPVTGGPVDLAALETGVGTSIGGKLTGSRPDVVQGNPGLAARYALVHSGRPSVAMVQFVARPGYVLAVLVLAPTASSATAEDGLRTVVDGLRLSGTPATASGAGPVLPGT
jgi:hypothetical protein